MCYLEEKILYAFPDGVKTILSKYNESNIRVFSLVVKIFGTRSKWLRSNPERPHFLLKKKLIKPSMTRIK